MDPMKINLDEGKVVASASSIADGRSRWTELYLWHLPNARRCWVAQSMGCSALPGEGNKERRIASARLERALELFDDSDLGVSVKASAHEWAEENGVPAYDDRAAAPAGDRHGLAWLFGVAPDDLSINAAGAALGVGESSLRMALKEGREVRVPLSKLLPFINRPAFQKEVTRG